MLQQQTLLPMLPPTKFYNKNSSKDDQEDNDNDNDDENDDANGNDDDNVDNDENASKNDLIITNSEYRLRLTSTVAHPSELPPSPHQWE
uniref:Uncharacterized protein n=1 Tax=Glossina pallidipes TaxID=7398 RepID=A0A1A9ZMR9_GLOPL